MKSMTIFLALMILSIPVCYACSPDACVNVTIDDLYVNKNGPIYLRTSGDESQLDCTLHSNVYIVLDSAANNFDAVYSLLLSAQIADRKVAVRIINGSNPCQVSYVRMLQQ